MIPYKFHFIWRGKNFSLMGRLAVESVRLHNPNAEIILHYQDPPTGNAQWDALSHIAELREIDENALWKALPLNGELREKIKQAYTSIDPRYPAGKSNILRYVILYREGGIYLDMDTITLKDFSPLLNQPGFIGEETVFSYDDDRVSGRFPVMMAPAGVLFGLSYYGSLLNCRYLNDHSLWNRLHGTLMNLWGAQKLNNAVLGCEENSVFFKEVIETVPQSDAGIKYSLGPMLMNKVWNLQNVHSISRYDDRFFYFIPPSQTFRFFQGPAPDIPLNAYCIHWCSSNHRKYADQLSEEALMTKTDNPSLIHILAREVIRNFKS